VFFMKFFLNIEKGINIENLMGVLLHNPFASYLCSSFILLLLIIIIKFVGFI
jgi:hypothetical protein